MDVRTEKQNIDDIGAMVWCHGAPGILYSRMKCYKYVKDQKWKKRLGKDVCRAYKKLKEYWRRDSWCLCHGICGNLWILEKASEVQGDKGGYLIVIWHGRRFSCYRRKRRIQDS